MGIKYLIKTIKVDEERLKTDSYYTLESDWLCVDPEKVFTINIFDKTYIQAVRCKDCKHKPTGSGINHNIQFPEEDYKCPCRCEDFWYSWMPADDWFCANGERKDEVEE